MPSVKTTTPILGGSYYHIFNRGTNKQLIFYQEKNYAYFLQLLQKFLHGHVLFLAYSLMPNHFHLILKINDEIHVPKEDEKNRSLQKERFSGKKREAFSAKRTVPLETVKDEKEIGKFVANQLKRLFITYSMAINKQEGRVGNVFDPKYKRLEITEQEYLEYAIFYTHFNPEKHGLINNFKEYRYSSFKALEGNGISKIAKKHVYEIFGGKEDFINYHNGWHAEKKAIIME